MNTAFNDSIEEEEISNLMSQDEYDSFMSKMERKMYKNDAMTGLDGNVIDPNDQISAGIRILEDNNIRL